MLRIQYHRGMPLDSCDLTRFDLEFDVPGHFPPEFPAEKRLLSEGRPRTRQSVFRI